MPRSLTLAIPAIVPLSWFAACASPPPTPLPLHEAFPTRYEGSIQPAAPGTSAGLTMPPVEHPSARASAVLPGDGENAANASVRAWLVQLPTAEAHAVLAGWAKSERPAVLGFGVGGRHVDRDAMLQHVAAWSDRGAVLASPFLATRLGQQGTTRVATQSAAIAGFQLRQGECALMLDPEVQRFEHGTEIGFSADRRGDDVVVTIDWQHSELLRPRTIASVHGGRLGSMEVPVLLKQHLVGETKVAPLDAVVLGVVPTATPDTVLLLCLETDTTCCKPAIAAIGGKMPTADARGAHRPPQRR